MTKTQYFSIIASILLVSGVIACLVPSNNGEEATTIESGSELIDEFELRFYLKDEVKGPYKALRVQSLPELRGILHLEMEDSKTGGTLGAIVASKQGRGIRPGDDVCLRVLTAQTNANYSSRLFVPTECP